MDSNYFIRNTRYMTLDGQLVLVERTRPGMVTVDEWSRLVFLSADGQHTVGELIASLGQKYPGGMPPGLADQTRRIVRDLEAHGYIVLLAERKPLPYYLAMPVEQQDTERAKSLMEADGFTGKAIE